MSWYFWLIFFPLIDVFLSVENENVGWDFWCISFPIILVLNGLFFGGLGGGFGTLRNRWQEGFWLGFFFGPSGWLLTLLLPPGTARTIPEQSGYGQCPTCGGVLVGPYPKCPHCAGDVFWAGRVPMKTAQEAADELDRQERLAAQRQRQHEEELERQREAQRRWEEQKREVMRSLTAIPRRLDSQLKKAVGKDNDIVYRFLQVFLYLVIPAVLLVGLGSLSLEKYHESLREQEKQDSAQRRRREKLADRQTRYAVLGFRATLDWDKVIADSNKAIERGTQDGRAFWNRGVARCANGEWKSAIPDLTDAIRLDAKDSGYDLVNDAYRFRGFARCVEGEWEPAISDLTEAVRLDPKDARAYAFRSVAYAQKGEMEKAQNDREHAKSLGFTPDEFAHLAEVLE